MRLPTSESLKTINGHFAIRKITTYSRLLLFKLAERVSLGSRLRLWVQYLILNPTRSQTRTIVRHDKLEVVVVVMVVRNIEDGRKLRPFQSHDHWRSPNL